MRINLKTAGTLGQFLPPGSARNTGSIDMPSGSTPIDVLEKLGMPTEESYLITRNGAIVPIKDRPSCVLKDNDQLSIMPPLKGG